METCRRYGLLLLMPICLASGCGLNTAVMQKGGNGRMGVLLNYSCGAHPCDPIDPSKPTVVMTHGWNPLPNLVHASFGEEGARALRCRCGDSYNLLSWDWNAVSVSPFHGDPFIKGRCQGKMLAAALRARGVQPHSTHLIGHSLGTLVVTQAAICLSDQGRMAQLTLLDPPTSLHEELFCRMQAQRRACIVENYWSPGISGYGGEVNCRGVRNYQLKRGNAPVRGIVDLSVSNHLQAMLWYYKTMCDPSKPCGFQKSVLLNYCGRRTSAEATRHRGNEVHGGETPSIASVAQVPWTVDSEEASTSAGSRKR